MQPWQADGSSPEQKEDTYRSVSDQPCGEEDILDDDDPPRSISVARGMLPRSGGPGGYTDSYDSLKRSDFYAPVQVGKAHSGGLVDLGARSIQNQKPQFGASCFQGPLKISMASGLEKSHRNTSWPPNPWDDHQSEDLSSDEGLMMEETDCTDTSGPSGSDGLPPLPQHFFRHSTYVSNVSSAETVEQINQQLSYMADATGQDRSTEFRQSKTEQGQFEGKFFQQSRLCVFMINTYSGNPINHYSGDFINSLPGAKHGDQTWMEIRNLESGFAALQAFSEFSHELVSGLTKSGVLKGLVDTSYEPMVGMQESTCGQEEYMSEEEEDMDGPSAEELRIVVKERVNVLRNAVYVMNQRALSNELLSITQNYPESVANDPDVANVLVGLLKKNAQSDIQMSMALLRVVRMLLDYKNFISRLQRKKLPKTLLQTALDVNSITWQNDIVRTVMKLEKAGLRCKSSRLRETYNRIKERL